MRELLILTSVVIMIVVVIALITMHVENNEKKKAPSVVYVHQPLTYGSATNQMFDAAVERFLRTKYGENFYCWKYAFDHGETKKSNEINLVLVTLKNGITSQEELKTQEIINSMGFGDILHSPVSTPGDTSSEEQEVTNESSPVEDWISDHASDIVTKIEKSLKNNYISIFYPVSDEYVSLIDEIVETLNDRMSYEITVVDGNTLKINFENLLAYDE